MKREKAKKRNKRLSVTFCAIVYLFLFLPISVIVVNSFNATTTKPYMSVVLQIICCLILQIKCDKIKRSFSMHVILSVAKYSLYSLCLN